MGLVFITRKVDRGDSLTGFVFGWLNNLAARLEKLYVICQEKGDTSGLASNIEVYSFGKEKGYGKIRQACSLWLIAFRLAQKTDGFFVHMHPFYAIIAWLPAKIFGKKIILWYTHKAVDWKLKIAHALVDTVFTASKESFRMPSKKVKVVGHGIDIEKFTPTSSPPIRLKRTGGEREGVKFQILSIGRISPVKDYETLVKAAQILYYEKQIKDFVVEIYGKIGLPEHQSYLDSLIEFIHNADLEGIVKFQGELNYEYADEAYQEADLFVNLSQTGSIDKTVLEAAACGIPVLTSNEAFAKPLGEISSLLFFQRDRPEELAVRIVQMKNLPVSEKHTLAKKLRDWVAREHDLNNLVKKIIEEFSL